ncbi:hypothetical protein ACFL21_04605 [Patescibacteria group bacterium]
MKFVLKNKPRFSVCTHEEGLTCKVGGEDISPGDVFTHHVIGPVCIDHNHDFYANLQLARSDVAREVGGLMRFPEIQGLTGRLRKQILANIAENRRTDVSTDWDY